MSRSLRRPNRKSSLPVRFACLQFGQVAVLLRLDWAPDFAFAVLALLVLDIVIGDVHAAVQRFQPGDRVALRDALCGDVARRIGLYLRFV